jgi:hypothetical protein
MRAFTHLRHDGATTPSRTASGRFWSIGAAIATVLGGLGLIFATWHGPGISAYVSESGVDGAPHAVLYRLAMLALTVAAAGAALALRPVAWLAALVLAGGVPCLLVSGAARCSPGCPLPPYERPTDQDLVHAAASIAAVALTGAAMLAAAIWCADRAIRRLSRWAAALTVPVGLGVFVALLWLGRSLLTGVLERVSLAVSLIWLAAVCVLRARAGPIRRSPEPG